MLESFLEGKDLFVDIDENDKVGEDFSTICRNLGRIGWEPEMVPDKLTANRFRIERSDTRQVLCPRRAFNEKFVPFTNERILRLGSAIFDSNPNLSVTSAASTDFGEKLLIKAKVTDKDLVSSVVGIGKVEPSLILVFNMASSMAKVAFTYKQLFCDNQIPSLAKDPLSKVLELDSKATDTLLIENSGKLAYYINDNVRVMMAFLEMLGKTLVTTRSIITLFSLAFNIPDIEKERPKLANVLLDYYESAPNAAPGTLLGGLNAITYYFVQYDYTTRRVARMASLPNSGQNAKVKKAMKIICEASKFDNVNDYFDVLI